MSQKQLVIDVIYESLQHNLHQLQIKKEYFQKVLDLSQYKEKITDFQSYCGLIEENTKHFISLVENGKLEEAKSFYYTTYKQRFESILPLVDFFTIKSIKIFQQKVIL